MRGQKGRPPQRRNCLPAAKHTIAVAAENAIKNVLQGGGCKKHTALLESLLVGVGLASCSSLLLVATKKFAAISTAIAAAKRRPYSNHCGRAIVLVLL